MEQKQTGEEKSFISQRAPDQIRRLTGGYTYFKTGDEEVFIGPNGQQVDWATMKPEEVARIGLEMDEYDQKEKDLVEKLAAQNEARMRKLEEDTRREQVATVASLRSQIEAWTDPARPASPKERTVTIRKPTNAEDNVFLGPTPQRPSRGNERAGFNDRTVVLNTQQGVSAKIGNFFKKLFS